MGFTMSDLDNLHDYPSWSDLGCVIPIVIILILLFYWAC